MEGLDEKTQWAVKGGLRYFEVEINVIQSK